MCSAYTLLSDTGNPHCMQTPAGIAPRAGTGMGTLKQGPLWRGLHGRYVRAQVQTK